MQPNVGDIVDIANRMLFMTALLSMPVLLTALGVGVLISLFQTVTGVQEMTITFVPKLLMVLLVIAVTLPWSIEMISEYTLDLWEKL